MMDLPHIFPLGIQLNYSSDSSQVKRRFFYENLLFTCLLIFSSMARLLKLVVFYSVHMRLMGIVRFELNDACGHQLVKHVVNSKKLGFMWSDLRGSFAEF